MEDSVDHYIIVATTRHRNVCPMLLHAVHCILFLLATIGRKSGDSFVITVFYVFCHIACWFSLFACIFFFATSSYIIFSPNRWIRWRGTGPGPLSCREARSTSAWTCQSWCRQSLINHACKTEKGINQRIHICIGKAFKSLTWLFLGPTSSQSFGCLESV